MHARNSVLLTLGTTTVLLATCITSAHAQSISTDSNFCDLMDAERLHVNTRDVNSAQTLTNSLLLDATQQSKKDKAAMYQTDLGLLYSIQENYTLAKTACEQSLAARKNLFGMRDISIAESFNALALVALETADYASADQYVQEAKVISEANADKDSLQLADSYDIIARIALAQGAFEKAESPAFKSFQLRSDLLGVNHPAVAQSKYTLALHQVAAGNIARASELLDESIAHGDSLQKTKSLFAKALVLAVQANPDESRKLFQQALDLRKATLGSSITDTAIKSQYAKFLWQHSMWLDAVQIRQSMPLHNSPTASQNLDSRLLQQSFDHSDAPAQFDSKYLYFAVSLIVVALGLIGIFVFLPQFMYMPGGTGVLDFIRTNRREDLNKSARPSTKEEKVSSLSPPAQSNQPRAPRSQAKTNSNLSLLPQRDSKPYWSPEE